MCCWVVSVCAALIGSAVALPQHAHASLCTVDGMLDVFERAAAQAVSGQSKAALETVGPLATMMFPPALGLMAELSAANSESAAHWGHLAERRRDQSGQKILAAIRSNGSKEALDKGRERADAQQAKVPPCLARPLDVSRTGDHALQIGPVTVSIAKSIDPKLVDIVKNRFPIIFNTARTGTIEGRLLLSSVRRIQIVGGDRYDRYVDWVPGNEGRAMRMTVGNILDQGPAHTAKAMTIAAQRALYDRIEGRSMIDPYFTVVEGIRVFTSIYPDVSGDEFVDSLRKALVMAKSLPKPVQRDFKAVDEIRYNPPSKHFIKFGAPDGAVAYYDKGISRPGRRVIFVRRDMRWSSHADLLLSIVHEGAHANQDAKAERMVAQSKTDRAKVDALVAAGQGDGTEATSLRGSIRKAEAYSSLWYLRDINDPAYKDRIRFECEALQTEIISAEALGLEPRIIETSPYLGLCSDQQKSLVSWKERRFQKSMDAYQAQ